MQQSLESDYAIGGRETQVRQEHVRVPRIVRELRAIWSSLINALGQHGDQLRVKVWFLDHDRYPRCLAPRIAALPANQLLWVRTMKAVWSDEIDDEVRLTTLMVDPQPPQDDGIHVMPHIILQQRAKLDMRSTLLTATMRRDGGVVAQKAVVLNERVLRINIVQEFDFLIQASLQDTQKVVVSHDLADLNDDDQFLVRGGYSFHAFAHHADFPGEVVSQPNEHDELAFMQQTDAVSLRHDHDITIEQGQLVGDDLPILQSQSEFIQQLFWQWRTFASELGDTCAHATVSTWYVDFVDFRRCTHMRAVELYDDFYNWDTQLANAWNDMMDPTLSIGY